MITAAADDDRDQNAPLSGRSLEPTFSVGRGLLAVGLFVVILAQNGENPWGFSALLFIYSLYAAALIFVSARASNGFKFKTLVVIHVVDVAWAGILGSFRHESGAAFLFVLFPLITAPLRWGPNAGLLTTTVSAVIVQATSAFFVDGSRSTYLFTVRDSISVVMFGLMLSYVSERLRNTSSISSGIALLETATQGTPIDKLQSVFLQMHTLFHPDRARLLVMEVSTGRFFVWDADSPESGGAPVLHSQEFNCNEADDHIGWLPSSSWVLHGRGDSRILMTLDENGRRKVQKKNLPEALTKSFESFEMVVSAPLQLNSDWQARFVICNPSPRFSPRPTLRLLTAFSSRVAGAVLNAHACLRVWRRATGEERDRMGRELHDGVIQTLLGIDLRLERHRHELADGSATSQELQAVQKLLRREAAELRNLINDSGRQDLDRTNLVNYISEMLEQFQFDTGIETRFFGDIGNEFIPPRVCREVSRLVQEALANIRKHSKASSATVRLVSRATNWILIIVDDGIGFDFQGALTQEQLLAQGFGPKVIAQRSRAMRANLRVESQPNLGARLEITIPKQQF